VGKRVTQRKLLRASMALNDLFNCDDADEVFDRLHDAVVAKMEANDESPSFIMLEEERYMPKTDVIVRLANYFAVAAVPLDDLPGYEPPAS
jgi:tetrahydromethanopterin S-methyltransferase subunit A